MSTRGRRIGARLLVITIAAALAGLIAEGFASLVLGRSVLRTLAGRAGDPGPLRMRMFDEERVRAAALSEGPYAADLDPLVSMKLKASFTYRFHDAPCSTDAAGLRTRPGPPPLPDAQRIVVLGDSIAFGFGVADDEAIARHLERFLSAAASGPGPRPVALTLACPGWSIQNSTRAMIDRIGDLKPDVVLLITAANDLDDSYTVIESGHRTYDVDPARGAAFPACSLTWHASMGVWRQTLFPSASPMKAYALYTGVTPESRRRYAATGEAIADLGRRLAAAGGRLGFVGLSPYPFELHVVHALAERDAKVPSFMVFDRLEEGDALRGDPHPNPRCAKATAWFLARWVVEQGWIRGVARGSLPPQDERYADRAGKIPDPAPLREMMRAWDQAATAAIGPRIDFSDGTGWDQMYGGVWPDGMVGNAAWGVVEARGRSSLALRIARLPGRAGLYPLSVRVFANETPLPAVDLVDPGNGGDPVVTRSFELPAGLVQSGFLDVRLVPSSWVTEQVRGISRLAAFKLLSIAAE